MRSLSLTRDQLSSLNDRIRSRAERVAMPNDLLSIEPSELRFPIELGKQVTSSLQFINQTQSDVAFKIKTTAPKNYCVRPTIGTVPPGESCGISVTMRALNKAPQDMRSKDKFLVQTVLAPHGAQQENALQELFQKAPGNEVNEVRLKVVFVQPPPTFANVTAPVSWEPKTAESPPDNSLMNMDESRNKDGITVEPKSTSGFSFFFVLVVAVVGILMGFFLRGELYV